MHLRARNKQSALAMLFSFGENNKENQLDVSDSHLRLNDSRESLLM